jgi:hypothetical protein
MQRPETSQSRRECTSRPIRGVTPATTSAAAHPSGCAVKNQPRDATAKTRQSAVHRAMLSEPSTRRSRRNIMNAETSSRITSNTRIPHATRPNTTWSAAKR